MNSQEHAAGHLDALAHNVTDRVAAALVGTALNGGDLQSNLATAIASGLLDTAASTSANWIGGNTSPQSLANTIAHAVAGCAVGAGRAAAGGGTSSGSGCGAGAIGAVVGELVAGAVNPNHDPLRNDLALYASQTLGSVAGAIVAGGQNPLAGMSIGGQAGLNAALNNYLSHNPVNTRNSQMQAFAEELSRCKATPGCSVDAIYTRYTALSNEQQAAANRALNEGDPLATGQHLGQAAGALRLNPADFCSTGDARCYSFVMNQSAQAGSFYGTATFVGILTDGAMGGIAGGRMGELVQHI